MYWRVFFILSLVALFPSLTLQSAEDEIRTWTDNTGKYTFEGSFVRVRGNEVLLKRTNGNLLKLRMSRLSSADREFLKAMVPGGEQAKDPLTGIGWYSAVEPAFAEAKRSRRPIMFMAAATQCSGVPGIF